MQIKTFAKKFAVKIFENNHAEATLTKIKTLFFCAVVYDNSCTVNAMLYDAKNSAKKFMRSLKKQRQPDSNFAARSATKIRTKNCWNTKARIKRMNSQTIMVDVMPLPFSGVPGAFADAAIFHKTQDSEADTAVGFSDLQAAQSCLKNG